MAGQSLTGPSHLQEGSETQKCLSCAASNRRTTGQAHSPHRAHLPSGGVGSRDGAPAGEAGGGVVLPVPAGILCRDSCTSWHPASPLPRRRRLGRPPRLLRSSQHSQSLWPRPGCAGGRGAGRHGRRRRGAQAVNGARGSPVAQGGLGHREGPVAEECLGCVAVPQQRHKLGAPQGIQAGPQAGRQAADGPRVQKGICKSNDWNSGASQPQDASSTRVRSSGGRSRQKKKKAATSSSTHGRPPARARPGVPPALRGP